MSIMWRQWTPKRKIVLSLTSGVLFVGALFLAVHWLSQHSDAYAEADRYIRSSAELASIVGDVQSTKLSWNDEVSVEENEVNGLVRGSAEFTIVVNGSRADAIVNTHLSKDIYGWHLLQSKILPNPSFQRTAARPLN